MTDRDDATLPDAARYALGTLDAAGTAAFEARMIAEPALRLDVIAWQEKLADAELPDSGDVPLSMWDGVKQEAWNERHQPWHARIRIWEYALGGLAAAGLAFLTLQQGCFSEAGRTALRAEVLATNGAGGLVVRIDPETHVMQVARAGLQAPQGQQIALWGIAGGAEPVLLGVLADEQISVLSVPPDVLAPLRAGALIAASAEVPGAAPARQPSALILGTAPLVRVPAQ